MEDKVIYGNGCLKPENKGYNCIEDLIDDLKNNLSIHVVINKLENTVVIGKRGSCDDYGEWTYASDITY